jgi:phage shock protein C
MNDPLYRSRSDRMLAGVAGGVAEHFDLDPSLVRVGWAILVILSGGIFLLIYIVMAIVVPEEPVGSGGWTSAGGWSGASGWTSSWPSSAGAAPGPGAPAAAAPPPASPGEPSAAPPPATDPAGAGFGAPIAGGWTPGAGSGPGPSSPPEGSARDARRAARDARHAARQANRAYRREHPGSGGVIAGLFLVAIGLFFLLRTLVPALDVDRYWPAGLIVLGVLLVALSIRRTPGGDGP